jgi:hypothetical protein
MYAKPVRWGAKKPRSLRSRTVPSWGAKKKRTVRKAPLPARFGFSKSRYYKNRSIASLLNKFSETKYQGIISQNQVAPVPIQALALAHMAKFVIGGSPSGWTDLTNLGGMTFVQGVSTGNRIGDYIYLKKTHLNIQIDMKAAEDSSNVPTEFRMIVCKQRRAANPAGTTRAPQATLFLDQEALDIGDATSGVNGSDLMLQPLNKRHWQIHKDIKFRMSNPLVTSQSSAYSGFYPIMRRFSLDLPYYQKCHFDDANQPTNIDYHYLVIFYARSLDRQSKADNWEINIRGNSQYVDN